MVAGHPVDLLPSLAQEAEEVHVSVELHEENDVTRQQEDVGYGFFAPVKSDWWQAKHSVGVPA